MALFPMWLLVRLAVGIPIGLPRAEDAGARHAGYVLVGWHKARVNDCKAGSCCAMNPQQVTRDIATPVST